MKCPVCGETGWVIDPDPPLYARYDVETVCPACDGSGKAPGAEDQPDEEPDDLDLDNWFEDPDQGAR